MITIITVFIVTFISILILYGLFLNWLYSRPLKTDIKNNLISIDDWDTETKEWYLETMKFIKENK